MYHGTTFLGIHAIRTQFGISPIKKWIKSGKWKMNYPNFYNIELDEQN